MCLNFTTGPNVLISSVDLAVFVILNVYNMYDDKGIHSYSQNENEIAIPDSDKLSWRAEMRKRSGTYASPYCTAYRVMKLGGRP